MKQKRRGTIALICGIICIVSSIIVLALGLIFGNDLVGIKDILMCSVWIALGIYFCCRGIKMRKKED